MSRIGKQPVVIPEKTEVVVQDGSFFVKGPHGVLSRKFKDDIKIEVRGSEAHVELVKETLATKALWGTYASHLKNMIRGVNTPFEKKLFIEGVGYKADTAEGILTVYVGFSHPVKIPIPQGLSVNVQKNQITISGVDKELVGQFAAHVRSVKKPEPYKGKGIRYENEVIRRKQRKKAA